MKLLNLAILLSLITASSLLAQEDDRASYFLNIGPAVPLATGGHSNYWNTGFSLEAGFTNPISNFLRFIGAFSYSKFSLDGKDILRSSSYHYIQTDGGNASVLTLTGGLRANLPQIKLQEGRNTVIPFVAIGGGAFRLTQSDAKVWYSYHGSQGTQQFIGERVVKPGLYGGGGIEFIINPSISFLVGTRYIVGITTGNGTSFIPIQLGLAVR